MTNLAQHQADTIRARRQSEQQQAEREVAVAIARARLFRDARRAYVDLTIASLRGAW